MKKTIGILLAFLMTLSLTACDDFDIDEFLSYDSNNQTTYTSSVEDNETTNSIVSEINEENVDDTIEENSDKPDDKSDNEITGEFSFATKDINGNDVTSDIIKDAKLIMVNFWEPWCKPCVGEMPDLQLLYDAYKDEGFLVLGFYTTEGMDSEIKSILEDCGTSYPILLATSNLTKFMTDYVPTTIFVDSKGNVISADPFIGSNSYSGWEDIIKGYLN
ncbi:MAG: TlpA family protein disulfide reductase [Lachnospiraceae bacterium]|nr:TlpA family protein disulfide reductase [Lachnospiraceae bacterium]